MQHKNKLRGDILTGKDELCCMINGKITPQSECTVCNVTPREKIDKIDFLAREAKREYVVRVVRYPHPQTCGACYSLSDRCLDCLATAYFPASHLIGETVLEAFEACGVIERSPESDKVYDIRVNPTTIENARLCASMLEALGFNAVSAPRWERGNDVQLPDDDTDTGCCAECGSELDTTFGNICGDCV